MPRNNSNNTLKQVAAFLLVIILLAVIGVGTWLGVVTNGFRDWSGFTGPSEPVEGGEQVSGVTDGDGNEMQSGEAYALPASMVYAVPTTQSATASEGITVTATVLPETAANKNVIWYISFAEQNEWSTGKTATDYVTVTPDEEDSRIATVVCEQAFGAQIVLTCASEWDPAITETCTIDYAQSITDVSVKIGNVDVNLGGETEVSVDINNNDTDLGGVIAVEYTLSEVYTLAIDTNLTETLSFINSQDGTDKDYFTQNYPSGTTGSSYHCDAIEDAEGKTLYFDLRMFDAYNFSSYSANYATGDFTIQANGYNIGDFDLSQANGFRMKIRINPAKAATVVVKIGSYLNAYTMEKNFYDQNTSVYMVCDFAGMKLADDGSTGELDKTKINFLQISVKNFTAPLDVYIDELEFYTDENGAMGSAFVSDFSDESTQDWGSAVIENGTATVSHATAASLQYRNASWVNYQNTYAIRFKVTTENVKSISARVLDSNSNGIKKAVSFTQDGEYEFILYYNQMEMHGTKPHASMKFYFIQFYIEFNEGGGSAQFSSVELLIG